MKLAPLLLVAGLLAAVAPAAVPPEPVSSVPVSALSTLDDPTLVKTYAELAALVTDATGNPILAPTDTTTYPVTDGSATVEVPYNMVYVPAGSFSVGTGSTATTATTAAYCIGRYEVTNAEYKAFLDATGATRYPTHWRNGTYPAGKDNHPVLYVSLTNALAYCEWVSARTGWAVTIPTSDQWEKAARGPSAWQYPWGNTADTSYNSTTGVLSTRFNYNGVVAAYYLFNQPGLAVTYSDTRSPYYGRTATVATINAYDTAGSATRFALGSGGSVNGWVNHDTYTGFIYTSLYDTLMETGGNTTPVGTYPTGRSAYGCHDMAGNVFEWTTSLITATNGTEAGSLVNEVRGGSWYSTGTSGRSISIGEGRSASGAYHSVGFRVVRNLGTVAGGTTTTPGTDTGTTTTPTSTTTTTTTTPTTTASTGGGGGGGGAPGAGFLAALGFLGLLRAGRRGRG